MKVIRYQEQEKKQNPHQVDVRQLYGSEHAQIMHITLLPGEGINAHSAPVDVIFIVLEGNPIIKIGDEKIG